MQTRIKPRMKRLVYQGTPKVKKAMSTFYFVSLVLGIIRLFVLYFEAFAQVRDERAQDTELLELCRRGAARGSSKMRASCIMAEADSAAPILFKACVKALEISYEEFLQVFSTPLKLFALILFFFSISLNPVNKWFMKTAMERCFSTDEDMQHDNDDLQHQQHVVYLQADDLENQDHHRRKFELGLPNLLQFNSKNKFD